MMPMVQRGLFSWRWRACRMVGIASVAAALVLAWSWGPGAPVVRAQVTETPTPTVTPTATATSTPTPTATPNEGCILEIRKSDSPSTVPEGGQITYTIRVENAGTTGVDCEDIVVTDEIPTDTDCVSASVESAPSGFDAADVDIDGCDASGTVTWDFGTDVDEQLDDGEEVVLEMVVELTSGADEGEDIENTACVVATGEAEVCDVETTNVGAPAAPTPTGTATPTRTAVPTATPALGPTVTPTPPSGGAGGPPGAYQQRCSAAQPGKIEVVFLWRPSKAGLQWLDLSLFDNGFAPATFLGVGPLPRDRWAFVWDGLLPGRTHYVRVNTLAPSGWAPSQTLAFTTAFCGGPAVLADVTQTCGAHTGTVDVVFRWVPSDPSGSAQWVDLSLWNNNFAPNTFLGAGALDAAASSFLWAGLRSGLGHYWRVNTLTPGGWKLSSTGSFVTGTCG